MYKLQLVLLLNTIFQLSCSQSAELQIQLTSRSKADIFLENLQNSNLKLLCTWIIIQHESSYESSQLDLKFLERNEAPRQILYHTYQHPFQINPESFHSSPFCTIVTILTDNLEKSEFDKYLRRSQWAALRNLKSMWSNYIIFFDTNSANYAYDIQKLALVVPGFGNKHPLKVSIRWDADNETFTATTHCWHCGVANEPDAVTGDKTKEAYITTNLPLEHGEWYAIDKLMPDRTQNLNQKSLLIMDVENTTCDWIHKTMKRERLNEISMSFEWYTIASLSKRFNFTCTLLSSFPNITYPDIFVGLPVLGKFFKTVQVSPALATDRVGFCYIEGESVHSWRNVFYSLQLEVWILILISWILFSVILWRCFTKIGFLFWLWTTYSTFLLQDFKLSKIMNFGLRFCVCLWLLFITIITSAYSSKLSSLLTKPRPTTQLPQTFEDLVNLNWAVGIADEHYKTYFDESVGTPSFNILRNKSQHFDDDLDCMQQAWKQSRLACISPRVKTMALYALRYHTDNSTAYRIRTGTDESFSSFGTGIGWRWWFPYRERFTWLITHLVSSALPSIWYRHSTINSLRIRGIQVEDRSIYVENILYQSGDQLTVMKLTHLKGSFIILHVGLLISLTVFLGEILQKFYEKMMNRFHFFKQVGRKKMLFVRTTNV